MEVFFSTHSYKLFGTTGIARGIQITITKKPSDFSLGLKV